MVLIKLVLVSVVLEVTRLGNSCNPLATKDSKVPVKFHLCLRIIPHYVFLAKLNYGFFTDSFLQKRILKKTQTQHILFVLLAVILFNKCHLALFLQLERKYLVPAARERESKRPGEITSLLQQRQAGSWTLFRGLLNTPKYLP